MRRRKGRGREGAPGQGNGVRRGGQGREWWLRLSQQPCVFADLSLSKQHVFPPLISNGPFCSLHEVLLRSGPELVAAAQAKVLAWLP